MARIKKSFDRDIARFTPRQMDAVNAMKTGGIKFMLYGGALGGGKLAPLSEPVLTPFGWRPIGDLRVGDTILNPDGKPQRVIAVHPQGVQPIYRVTCNDGASTLCGLEHLWLVNKTQRNRNKRNQKWDPFIGNRFFGGEIWTTGQIRDWIECKSTAPDDALIRKQNLLIPLTEPLQFTKSYRPEHNQRTIHPYLLGVLIGDGSITCGLNFTSLDEEIPERLRSFGYDVTNHKNPRVWGIVKAQHVKDGLRKLGLAGCKSESKFIPECYKWACLDDRKLLIQGLMDTDGYVDKRGHCSFTTVSRSLAQDFQWVVRSLGGKATITDKRPFYRNPDGERVEGQIAYTVYYRTKIDHELVWLERKRCNTTTNFNNGLGELSRAIQSVEYVSDDEAVCISVSNPNGLYLTSDFIVTHNSYFLRWYTVRRLMELGRKGFKGVPAMVACENYPALKDRQLSKIGREFPPWLGRFYADHKEHGRSYILAPKYGSGIICFRNLDDTSKYQSAEFALIAVDELTKNLYETFTFLWTRLRWPGIPALECQFMAATNPGGVGHGWVKQLWMDKTFPDEWREPTDWTTTFKYVPSTAADNPHLDPTYWAMLSTLPAHLREAFKNGDWNVFVGQAFTISRETHAIKPIWPIPQYTPIYMTFDWGFGKPFSLGWWWIDSDGRLIRCAEWYGWNGTPDEGLRLADSDVAKGIVERERSMGIWGRNVIRLAGPDCFQKRPDYRGGGQGPSTAEVFAAEGVFLAPGDPSRALKIRAFRERTKLQGDALPMMVAYETCDQFFRTIPTLVVDSKNPEDVETSGEDHCLHGDTSVCTDRGNVPIRDLVGTTGKVLSVNGYTKYHSCRLTRRNAPVVKITFADRRSIVCTDDHRFLTAGGFWVKAKNLIDEKCHISMASPIRRRQPSCESLSLTAPHKNSTEHATTFAATIFSEKARGFIVWFGSTITEAFPKALTCIMLTMTDLITRSRTLLLGKSGNIVLTMPKPTTIQNGPEQCMKEPPHGMAVLKELNGIGNTSKSTAGKHSLEKLPRNANSAEPNSLDSSRQDFAPDIVQTAHGGLRTTTGSPVNVSFVASPLLATDDKTRRRVLRPVDHASHGQHAKPVRIEPAGNSDVFCLDVEDASHAFAVCGGILVHNCYDECCHLAMARPMTGSAPQKVLSMAEQDFDRVTDSEDTAETY